MLKFIGNGGAFNTKAGNNSAYFELGTELFLIDSGEDVFAKLLKKDLFHGKTRVNIFITHLHSDHVGSLGTLIAYLYIHMFNEDPSKICVYFPSDAIKELLNLQGISEQCYTFFINRWDELYIDAYEKHPEYIFEPVPHVNELNYNNESNCYSIEFSLTDEFSFYYSGDTNQFSKKLENTYAYDVIYHEVTNVKEATAHSYYETIVEMTKDMPADQKKKVTFMHLDEEFDVTRAIEDGFSVSYVEE